MNPLRLLGKLYGFIWRRIGGRPWTHISRDSLKSRPNRWILSLVMGGVAANAGAQELLDWRIALFILGSLSIGYTLGHIFWCGHTLRINLLGIGSHIRLVGLGLILIAGGLYFGAFHLMGWRVFPFLGFTTGASFILGHIFWCIRPPILRYGQTP